MERKAKIITTIGPASESSGVLEEMILAGINVARFNFSHGTQAWHGSRISKVCEISKRLNHPVAILQDLQGPKIRVGSLKGKLSLVAGERVLVYPEGKPPPPGKSIPVDFQQLFSSIKKDDRILLDDGRIRLLAISLNEDIVDAEVEIGGDLTSNKGINLPGVQLDIPAFTEKDAEDLVFGLSVGVDIIAVSFVRKADDLVEVSNIINRKETQHHPLLIAKLERPEALDNLEDIMEVSDGVMVARGDLGVEMAPEDVPAAQKRIIQEANKRGKIVVTATQMLESMIHNPLPTRAEASDVANAVFDGTDAVMLSGETASGAHPVESVKMMDRIVRNAETNFQQWGHLQSIQGYENDDAIAICLAARELAQDRDVAAIAVFTRTGRTALLLSKARPSVPILALTPVDETYRRLSIGWGIIPHHVDWANTVEEMIQEVEMALKHNETIKTGQQLVIVSGYPVPDFPLPNMALLHTVR